MKKILLSSVVLAFVSAYASPASVAFPCGERTNFVETLDSKYHESPKAIGIANQTNLVEVFTSEKGTWTIMVTQPTGKTCIIAAGSSWADLDPTPVRTEPAMYKR